MKYEANYQKFVLDEIRYKEDLIAFNNQIKINEVTSVKKQLELAKKQVIKLEKQLNKGK